LKRWQQILRKHRHIHHMQLFDRWWKKCFHHVFLVHRETEFSFSFKDTALRNSLQFISRIWTAPQHNLLGGMIHVILRRTYDNFSVLSVIVRYGRLANRSHSFMSLLSFTTSLLFFVEWRQILLESTWHRSCWGAFKQGSSPKTQKYDFRDE
jgi:hypothetical protein